MGWFIELACIGLRMGFLLDACLAGWLALFFKRRERGVLKHREKGVYLDIGSFSLLHRYLN